MPLTTNPLRQSANALLAWLTTIALLALAVENARSLDPLWGGLTLLVVAVAVAPVVVFRSWRRMPPWPLLVLATVPLLVRAVGPTDATDVVVTLVTAIASPLTGGAPVIDGSLLDPLFTQVNAYADAVVIGTLSLLAVVELQRFSSLRLSVRFASQFVAVATVGLVGLWTVVRWVADGYLGTGFLDTNAALMAEFGATMVAAAVAGGLFAPFFCRGTNRSTTTHRREGSS
jgi:hypothetical protein